MFAPLAPWIFFFLILLISRASGFSWRESVLAAAVVWGLLLAFITEMLSGFGALSYPTILAAWLLAGGVFAVLYLWLFKGKEGDVVSRGATFRAPLLFVLPTGFIVFVCGLIAFVAPPNNYDSMTYHMGRVVHWIQNHGVQHYSTMIDRQLFMPPWAEFAVTHFYVLSGGDRLANGVQWFSMVGSLVGVSLITKLLGGKEDSQWLAVLVAACLPMGILQSSSTQTDYVVTFWSICLIFNVLCLMDDVERQRPITTHLVLAGSSLGLALLTKPTAYLLAAPFVAWLALSLARSRGVRSVQIIFAILAIAVVINGPHYLRNVEVFGSPLAPRATTAALANLPVIGDSEASSLLRRSASNLIRSIASELATPFYRPNRIVEGVIEKLELFLFHDNDRNEFELSVQQNHEDYAGNPIHFVLLGACGVLVVTKAWNGHLPVSRSYSLALFGAFLAFFLLLHWNVWISRLHIPLFVLGAPLIAIAISGPSLSGVRMWIVGLLVVVSQYALFYNETRPLIGGKSIFVVPRQEQYFRTRTDLFPQYVQAVNLLKGKQCSQIGFLTQDVDSWEYPLWVLFEVESIGNVRIEHLRIASQSARGVVVAGGTSEFTPCGLVAVNMVERPDLITEAGREYFKAWTGKKVAVYEVR